MKKIAVFCFLSILSISIPSPGISGVRAEEMTLEDYYLNYPSSVSPALCTAEYWTSKNSGADQVLLTFDDIQAQNQAFLQSPNTNMCDLAAYPDTVNQTAVNASLQASFDSQLDQLKKYYRPDGTRIDDSFCSRIRSNLVNSRAQAVQSVGYLICTTRTGLLAYPTADPLLDDASDPDMDNNQTSTVRVNEPLVALSLSADGKFYYCKSGNCSGWVSADHVAVCQDKAQWLVAWRFDNSETLVVTGDRLLLSDSNANTSVSNVELSMGTTLKLVAKKDIPLLVNHRSTYQNYVVYLPVRQSDGTLGAQMALVNQSADVHAGFLPLTSANLAKLAFKELGNVYGWGGMLHSSDCSLYLCNIYRCFGFQLPRNTTWQKAMPAKNYPLEDLSDDSKKQILDTLPLGTILFIRGHEMMYLGSSGGEYYVISSLGSVMDPDLDAVTPIRSIIVSPLSTLRGNKTTWLSNLTAAVIPYRVPDAGGGVGPGES